MGKVGGNPRSSEVPPRLNFAVGDREDISPQPKSSGPLRERFMLASKTKKENGVRKTLSLLSLLASPVYHH